MGAYEQLAVEAHSLSLRAVDRDVADLARLVRLLAEQGSYGMDSDETPWASDVEQLAGTVHDLEGDVADLSTDLRGAVLAHEYLKAEVEVQGKALDLLERERPA